jgi:hypothetical protein
MDQLVRTFDPKQVAITFGPLILTGFASGTFVNITRDGDTFEKHRGGDGGVDRVNTNVNDYRVTITLKQTSQSNLALSALLSSDQVNNSGVLPLIVKDVSGNSLFTAPQAWIAKDPDDEYSDTMSNREWMFDTGISAKISGGN